MTIALRPNEVQVYAALYAFLMSVLPSGTTIIRGQANRVSEPLGNFVVMTSMFRNRLSTNVHTYADTSFMGSVSGNTLTISEMLLGSVSVGASLFGVGVLSGTTITANETGSGGVGTYQLSSPQTITSAKLACGSQSILQPTQVTVQLDVHGPNAPDNAGLISTLFRDEYAASFFLASGLPVSPFHADDPKQVPFVNAEQQYEYRWVVTALVQVDQAAIVPQDFADQLVVGVQPPVNEWEAGQPTVPAVPSFPQISFPAPPSPAVNVGGGQIRYAQAQGLPAIDIPAGQRTLITFTPDPTQTQDFLNPPFEGNISFDGTTIRPYRVGDFYFVLVNLLVVPQVTGGTLYYDIDVGSPTGPTTTDSESLRDAGIVQRCSGKLFTQDLKYFNENGAELYVTPTVPISIQSQAVLIAPLST